MNRKYGEKFQRFMTYIQGISNKSVVFVPEEAIQNLKVFISLISQLDDNSRFELTMDNGTKINFIDSIQDYVRPLLYDNAKEFNIEYKKEIAGIILDGLSKISIDKVKLILIECEMLIMDFSLIGFTEEEIQLHCNTRVALLCDIENSEKRMTSCTAAVEEMDEVIIKFIGFVISFFWNENQGLTAYGYVYVTLEEFDVSEKVTRFLLDRMISTNNKFVLYTREYIEDIIDDYEEVVEEQEFEFLKALNNSLPSGGTFSGMQVGEGKESDLFTCDVTVTEFHFMIPYRLDGPYESTAFIIEQDKYDLEYKNITKGDDPFVKSGLIIGSIPCDYISDISEEGTYIVLCVRDFLNLDREWDGDKVSHKSFSKEKALYGRYYNPYKWFLVDFMLEHKDAFIEIGIEEKNLNSELFSNFLVRYRDAEKKSIYHTYYLLTTPRKFDDLAEEYLADVQQVALTEAGVGWIYDVIKNPINKIKPLRTFITRYMREYVGETITYDEVYPNMWIDYGEKPKTEPNNQPLLFGLMKKPLAMLGIKVVRENETADGELDYLITRTTANRVLSVCIELKNAHGSIETGLIKQLPRYMLKGESTQHGIFVVLWFKTEKFNEPKGYATPKELEEYLEKIKPKVGLHIDVVVIDCTKPTLPSKLKLTKLEKAEIKKSAE